MRHIDRQSVDDLIKGEDGQFIADRLYKPSKEIGNLSMNLLGHFKLEDNLLALTDAGMAACFDEECPPNYNGILPGAEHFTIIDLRIYWGINLKVFDDFKNVAISHGANTLIAKCIIEHKPTKRNFWHFEINWLLDNKKISENPLYSLGQKEKFHKRIDANVRSIIKLHATDKLTNIEGLKLNCYSMNTGNEAA